MNCKCFDVLKEGLKDRDKIDIDVRQLLLTDDHKIKSSIALYAKATSEKRKTVYVPLTLNYCPFCGAKIEEDKK